MSNLTKSTESSSPPPHSGKTNHWPTKYYTQNLRAHCGPQTCWAAARGTPGPDSFSATVTELTSDVQMNYSCMWVKPQSGTCRLTAPVMSTIKDDGGSPRAKPNRAPSRISSLKFLFNDFSIKARKIGEKRLTSNSLPPPAIMSKP